mmetsp:Transcript_6907/g.16919  ORF Transcript_6907/g.16919 Transcript_6907/m.16919 type:complete len:231 (+) Transcript_6907:128-820(+)
MASNFTATTTTPGYSVVSSSSASKNDRRSRTRTSSSSLCRGFGRILTKSKAFRTLVSKSFDSMDDNGNGSIDRLELYAGVLLVHLNLAKYVGPAACYPPDRDACDRLFEAADRDDSGNLDRNQFHWIMGVLCARILSRIFAYYVVLILLVPVLASKLVSFAGIPKGTYTELAIQQAFSCGVFFLAIPVLWDAIDARYSGGRRTRSTAAAGRHKKSSRRPHEEHDGDESPV